MSGPDEITTDELLARLRGMDEPRTEWERFMGRRLTVAEEADVREQVIALLRQVGRWPPGGRDGG